MEKVTTQTDSTGKNANRFLTKLRQSISDGVQLLSYSVLFSHLTFIPYVHAGPTGGAVVGGSGNINQSGLNTTINQTSQNMAIDWQTFNVNVDERVQYIQPNSSAISLNRILSNTGSTIAGRIDANGQVILVNPNGVVFTPTAMINVGGMLASGLDISSADFMNGDYIFNEVMGAEGAVINSGTINASLGGNVALLGRSVENNGLISAQLGSVNLAAGKQAVVSFDNTGLMGVRVTREVLQNELGVDPAVLNSGDINAAGGRVLMTGSVSKDIFASAVNIGNLEQATSAVSNGDGSFSLGAGADVVNTGSVNVSSADSAAGQIVMLGENVTSSGNIEANSNTGTAGKIELHAGTTAELTQNSRTTARAEITGSGGDIKLLGKNVGVLNSSIVDASGANGGGSVLIGGDQLGQNTHVRNANFIFLGENTNVKVDALVAGAGGKLIAYADDTARIYGELFARGGVNGGDGGFIETSGKQGFEILHAPDVSSSVGKGGLWLIDPYNISIVNSGGSSSSYGTSGTGPTTYTSSALSATINVGTIQTALGNGDVSIITGNTPATTAEDGNIIFNATLNYDTRGTKTLTLQAANNITFLGNSVIVDGSPSASDSLNLNLIANGTISIASTASITTQGGNFTAAGNTASLGSFTNNGTINTSGRDYANGGNISITTTGAVASTGLTTVGGYTGGPSTNSTPDAVGRAGGNITINAASVAFTGNIDTRGSAGTYDANGSGDNGQNGGNGGYVDITATSGNISVLAINTSGGLGAGDYTDTTDTADGGDAGAITLNAGSSNLTLGGNLTSTGAIGYISGALGSHGSGGNILLTGNVALTAGVNMNAAGAMDTVVTSPVHGDITINGAVNGTIDNAQNLTITGNDVTFNDALGSTTRLGDVAISAVNSSTDLAAITANAIYANSFTVSQAASISSGAIDTSSSVASGGNIAITSTGAVSVGSLNSSSTLVDGSGGTVVIDAGQITLNGNVDARGNGFGVSRTAALTLTSPGTLTINHTGNFSSPLTLAGSTGTDTIIGANRTNNWTLTGNNSGSLNSNLTFSNMENLTGNDGQDIFNVASSGNFAGTINGGAGINDEVRGGSRNNSWVITGTNSGTVTGLNNPFSNIEILTGNNSTDTFQLHNSAIFAGSITGGGSDDELIGGNRLNNWAITASTGGTVTGLTGGFSGIEALTGGDNQDIFQLHDTISFNGDIDGGAGNSDQVIGGNRANNWVVTGNNNTGTVTGISNGNTFTNVELLTGNNAVDIFQLHNSNNFDGSIDGGGGLLDEVRGGSRANTWTITGTNNTGTVTGITGAGHTFSNVEILTGSSNTDTFILHNSINFAGTVSGGSGTDEIRGGNRLTNWAITGNNNSGTVTGLDGFSEIETLTGNSNQDIFQLHDIYNYSGTVDGGGGSNDELRAGDRATNTWIITNANRGTVTGIAAGNEFINIENLTGGSDGDDFNFNSNGSISGSIDGGNGYDQVDLSLRSNVTVNLGSSDYFNIEYFTADTSSNNTFVGNSATENSWAVTSPYTGTVSAGGNTIGFSGFHVLTGGDQVDTFTIASNIRTINAGADDDLVTVNNGGVVGTINLGDNNDIFTIYNGGTVTNVNGNAGDDIFRLYGGNSDIIIDGGDGDDFAGYTGLTPVSVGAANSGLEGVNASNGMGTLVAQDGVTTDWVIDGPNSGSLSYSGQSLLFTGFTTLNGGSGDDNFIVRRNVANSTTGTIAASGSINGNGGTNTLTLELTGLELGQVRYIGTTGDDTVSITGATGSYTAAYIPGVSTTDFDQLTYTSSTNTPYTVSYQGVDAVVNQRALTSLTVNGTIAADVFNLGTGSGSEVFFGVNTNTPVYFTNTSISNLIVNGLADDTISINSAFNIGANNLRLIAGTITNSANTNVITANNLVIESLLNDMTGSRLITNINDLALVNTTGAVMVADSGSLNISQLNNASSLDLTANGDITTGNLNSATALTLSATGDITVQNAAETNIQGMNAQNVNINSVGSINGNGDMVVSGVTTLQSAGDINLGAANDFNVVNVVSANNVLINDVNNLALGSLNAANVDIHVGGSITDNNGAAVNIAATNVVLRAESGIGTETDAIETQVADFDVINGLTGFVNISNTGGVTLTNLVNEGNIIFRNAEGDVLLDHVETNYDTVTGDVRLAVTNGSIFGVPRYNSNGQIIKDISIVDIKGYSAIITTNQAFGTFERPIVLNIKSNLTYVAATGFEPVIYGNPLVVDSSALQANAIGTAGTISGQQLIELESLADIDPAIFTAVRNYNYDDISIRMPSDQLYEDDDEEEENLR